MSIDRDDDALASVTLAKLLAADGDVQRARRVLRVVLRRRPDDQGARALLQGLGTRAQTAVGRNEPGCVPAPRAARADDLAARFRRALSASPARSRPAADRRHTVARLERWLQAILRSRAVEACPSRGSGDTLGRRPDAGGAS